MMRGLVSALAQQRAMAAQASQNRKHAELMMDVRAAKLQQIHGAAYAGMDEWGRAILWRKTTIPAVSK